MPVVSIIVPMYNREQYIAHCIQSVCSQTFSDWELILSDDGSTDDTLPLCGSFAQADARIRVLENPHGGVSAARNAGLEAASGQYITFLDSDDSWESDFLETAINFCKKNHPDILMAGCHCVKDGRVYASSVIQDEQICKRIKDLSQSEMAHLLSKNYLSSVWSKLFLREIIGNIRFPRDMNFGEDLTFVYDILLTNPNILAINKAFYNYNKTDGSLVNSITVQKCYSMVQTYRVLFASAAAFGWDASGTYYAYLQNRCAEDICYTQNAILHEAYPIRQKIKMLNILISNPEILAAVQKVSGKTRLGKFSFHPYIMLLRSKLRH